MGIYYVYYFIAPLNYFFFFAYILGIINNGLKLEKKMLNYSKA